MNESFHMITLGCDKSRVDAEIMLAKLLDAGYVFENDLRKADFAIINTCGFIYKSQQESVNEIIQMSMYKGAGNLKYIIVTGCLAERYKTQVIENLPDEVDAVVGLGANKDIVQIVQKVLDGEKVTSFPPKEELLLNAKRMQSTPEHYAYLRIAEGCNNRCSYCKIPDIRGKLRSLPIEDVVKQAKTLVVNGVKELIVVAQDTTAYGEDIYGRCALVELLKELIKISDLKWIRLLYCYPHKISDELLELIAKEKKVVKYLDIPMQHCNERILKDMHRPGNTEYLTKLIKHIREKVPGIALRTTFIIGFPGETKEEFKELLQFAYDMRFERMGCFDFSPEEDTIAGDRKDQTSNDDKIIRKRTILYQQAILTDEYNKSLKGKVFDVIHDGYNPKAECFYGRSYTSTPDVDPVIIYSLDKEVKPGTIIKVKIRTARFSDLVGDVVDYGEEENFLM